MVKLIIANINLNIHRIYLDYSDKINLMDFPFGKIFSDFSINAFDKKLEVWSENSNLAQYIRCAQFEIEWTSFFKLFLGPIFFSVKKYI